MLLVIENDCFLTVTIISISIMALKSQSVHTFSNKTIESWIEVTPQGLGYLPSTSSQYRISTTGEQARGLESGGFHTILEEQLLTRLLSEAQDHSDRASDVSPSDDVSAAGHTDGNVLFALIPLFQF